MSKFQRMFRVLTYSLSVVLFTFLLSNSAAAQDGEKLFKANCSSCHKLNKKLIGPALSGVQERWEDQEALYAWIKNSQDYLKKNPGDSYAQELFLEYNKSVMTAQAVSDVEIGAILDYIANPPADKAPPVQLAVNENAAPAEDNSTYWLFGIVIILVIVARILSGVRSSLETVKLLSEGKEILKPKSFIEGLKHWTINNKRYTVLIVVLILASFSVKGWYALKSIGVYQGYAPEQPIKFSHKIHAGVNAIECAYCHHSAYKGKNAGIPSVNVCMNCHEGISEGKVDGTVEIAKIYEAAGWDADDQSYTGVEKPIKWIRIHNLPDFAYFNHSQHVVVGKQKCETCHGEVSEYGYPMKQYSELTMGWCINCHRETTVAMEGNEYYTKIHNELLERYKDEEIDAFTVEHIGGLECGKCHY
ncbi:MAG: mono/diheme cytochrome c family protein [Salibacteraceae bacterium]|jgi:mono/diheme cytochrome c family protein